MTISLTSVGDQFSEAITLVFVTNNKKNPMSTISRKTLKVEGEVKIDGSPKVKLDDDTKIKIESIEKPVKVQFVKNDTIPETDILKNGKGYNISFDGKFMQRCDVEKTKGTWIFCAPKPTEGEISGRINTAQLSLVVEVK